MIHAIIYNLLAFYSELHSRLNLTSKMCSSKRLYLNTNIYLEKLYTPLAWFMLHQLGGLNQHIVYKISK